MKLSSAQRKPSAGPAFILKNAGGSRLRPSARNRRILGRIKPRPAHEFPRGGGVHRLAEGRPVRELAAQLRELDRVGFRLRPLRDDVHADLLRHRDDGMNVEDLSPFGLFAPWKLRHGNR